jgi:hypothetical protein
MKKFLRPLAIAAATVGVSALTAGSALAAGPTGDSADFSHCPYTNPSVQSCIHSLTTSGSFKLGNTVVPVTAPITFQGGYSFDFATLTTTFYPAVGADTLSKTPLNVPGGLLGLVNPGGFGGILEQVFEHAISFANGVTATAELVGPAHFDFWHTIISTGPSVTLPVRVHLQNTFLGPDCYVGSSAHPITLNLTEGTTSPPAGVAPMTGFGGVHSSGTIDPTVNIATGVNIVDNTFSVPAASGCGFTFLDKPLITAAVNLKEGFPSAVGVSSASLIGTTKLGSSAGTAASVH